MRNRFGFGMMKTRHLCAASVLLAFSPWLGGCSDTGGGLIASATDAPRTSIALRPGVRPSSVTVAFKSLDGAPPEVTSRFVPLLSTALASRDIVTADSGSANFIVQGHLSAYPAEGGVAVAWVWDVFDRKRFRRQRMDDAVTVRGSPANPWGAVDDQVLTSIAGLTAENLAGFLTNSPEAVAASGAAAGAAVAEAAGTAALPARAQGFAPLD